MAMHFRFTLMRGLSVYKYFADYFPIKLIKTADLDPNQTYLMGSHPHGIICFGAFTAFGTDALGFREKFPGLFPRMLTLKHFYFIPGIREMLYSNGLCAASKKGMDALLKYEITATYYILQRFNKYFLHDRRRPKGTAAVLVVGGAREVIYVHEKEIQLILNSRKGFIKLALKHGRNLVPTFSFGENYVYDQWVRH